MRVTREQAAANRARVVEAAAGLFRDRGVDGVGLVDLMGAAGLTHGGFYNHFASKQHLAGEAVACAFDQAVRRLERRSAESAGKQPREALADYVARYLSRDNCDAPGPACPMAALGTDAARQGPAVRHAFAAGVARYLDAFAALMPPDGADADDSKQARRAAAISTLSTLIGGLTLARAVDDAGLSDEILATVAASLAAEAPGGQATPGPA